jgi:hypothetical protein
VVNFIEQFLYNDGAQNKMNDSANYAFSFFLYSEINHIVQTVLISFSSKHIHKSRHKTFKLIQND